MLSKLSIVLSYFFCIINQINCIQQFSLVLLLLVTLFYCVKNSLTRSYLFKIIIKLLFMITLSLIINFCISNLIVCEQSNNINKILLFSVGTISVLAGITYWVYRNHSILSLDYKNTIDEQIILSKYNYIKGYTNSFLTTNGKIPVSFLNTEKLGIHVIWNRSVFRIFQNIHENKTCLTLKEWLGLASGLEKLNKHSRKYLIDLHYVYSYRSKYPELFNLAYMYYQNPDKYRLMLKSDKSSQKIDMFEIVELLKRLDIELIRLAGPTNLIKNRTFFITGVTTSEREKDFFFSAFAGIDYKKYTQIESGNKYTFDQFPLNSENIVNHSFVFIYPFFWIIEKSLGLPNPIPSDLVMCIMNDNVDSFYRNAFPSVFKITSKDLFNPYFFSGNPITKFYPLKSTAQSYVCDLIEGFQEFWNNFNPPKN